MSKLEGKFYKLKSVKVERINLLRVVTFILPTGVVSVIIKDGEDNVDVYYAEPKEGE